MFKDLNKGIQGILYNQMNLPREMVISHTTVQAKNYYTYTANGVKVQVIHKADPKLTGQPFLGSIASDANLTDTHSNDYVGNKIYEDGILKMILTDNGYYDNLKNTYYFYIKDHLGNNRIVADASGTSIQSNQYYPFGMAFAEGTVADQGKQPYKYNGKELDKEHGLNWYDYSARYFSPDVPRFTTMDPLAEKYYSWSPYVYVMNNPLKYVDPTGMWTQTAGGYTTSDPQDIERYINAINQAGQQILSSVGLSKDQLQSENPTVREDASQKREQAAETMHSVNESMLSVIPGADVVYKAANDREITKSDVAWATAGLLPIGKIGKIAKVAEGAGDAPFMDKQYHQPPF